MWHNQSKEQMNNKITFKNSRQIDSLLPPKLPTLQWHHCIGCGA
ncbi:hypothetical protein SOHN41_03138 [Shewanella sp. HN-41]|nr:hypothetical protein SOHN41_03138 [Shewanella sp. HN-41]